MNTTGVHCRDFTNIGERMRVLMPGRIVERHVGGNTTYARNLIRGLESYQISVASMPYARRPAWTMALETVAGVQRYPSGTLLHYVADTGPLVRTLAPSVVTVHGVASRWTAVARRPWEERIWRERVRRAIVGTRELITVSNSSADDISEIFGVDRELINVIHHGIDVAKFTSPASLSEQVNKVLPAEFLLYVGNIEPRKNNDSLVRALASAGVAGANIPLVIAGRPAWHYEDTLRLIESSKNVIYLGFVSDSDRTALMQRCSLFVFPSLYEGFGFPVLEAMAAGAPVLTSRAGSLKEVSGPAMCIDDLSIEGIAHALDHSLEHLQSRSGNVNEGRDWASKFTWQASVSHHIAVYAKAMNQ